MPADYSGQNLRGRSFRGQNLEGADFSEADICSADFTGANLTGANFRHAKAGLKKQWATFLVVASWAVSIFAGLFSALASSKAISIISSQVGDNQMRIAQQTAGGFIVVTLIVFFLVTIRQGIQAGLGAFFVAFIFVFTFTGAVSGAVVGAASGAVAYTGAIAVAVTVAFIVSGAVAYTVAVAGAVVGAIAFSVVVAGAVADPGADTFVNGAPRVVIDPGVVVVAVAGAVVGAVAVVFLTAYISWKSLKGESKYALIRDTAIFIAAFKGTSFHSANLTDANFTEATLKSTDFREAVLTRTYWWNARKLNLALSGTTYLHNVLVRQLVVTGDGKNQNFDRLDLRGINLRDANLENASFIDTDFYKATLQEANLSRAILVRTQMERADLRGACLTGSCIQDWTISRETKLDGIICDYVYLKLFDGDKRDQMPHRGKFKKNGFVLFAKYILDTIDIYHNKDINPRLALTVLKKMSKDYDEPLDIVAVGKRDDKVFIKVKISEAVEPTHFKEDYLTRYEDGLKLVSSSPRSLPSVDELIENRLVEIASESTDENSNINITYVEYLKAPKDVVIQGEVIVETIETGGDAIHQSGSFGIGVNKGEVNTEKLAGTINENNPMSNNYDLSNAKFGGGFAGTGGTQTGGTLYDYSSNPSLAQAAAEIQQLLQEVEATNPTTTSVSKRKRAVVNQAIEAIENNPALKAKVIAALNASGTEALKTAINHPLAKNMMPFIEELTD